MQEAGWPRKLKSCPQQKFEVLRQEWHLFRLHFCQDLKNLMTTCGKSGFDTALDPAERFDPARNYQDLEQGYLNIN